MLFIHQNVVDAVSDFVGKRWPKKTVSCQDNENAQHKNRFISISTPIPSGVVQYKYHNGYLELLLEGSYYENDYNFRLYRYLRDTVVSTGKCRWHMWNNMRQGLLRFEKEIDNELELGEALQEFISYIDPILEEFNSRESLQVDAPTEQPVSVPFVSTEVNFDTESDESTVNKVELYTMSLQELFGMKLRIPSYQRIYCWPQKNVELLLEDIFTSRNHKYHLGTVILQRKEESYDIIDGQQRLVTLALVMREMGITGLSLLDEKFDSVEAVKYIGYNRYLIESYLKRTQPDMNKRPELAGKIMALLSFDVLILQDSSLDLAYTFFSTQNARGKALTDYELLKSHHLRYIPESYEAQQRLLARRWDEILVSSERENGDKSVSTILGIYLYCLRKWTRRVTWYIKETNRVKNEFEAAPTIPEIPPFGERFDFMDPIQGGSHFFAFVENFIQQYHQYVKTPQYGVLWETVSCSGLLCKVNSDGEEIRSGEGKRRTHWWFGDVISSFLFAYYMKFGNQYLSEALTCITRIVSQLRYETSKANKQSLMDKAGGLGIIQMINQATSPTFFLAEARDIIKRLPFFDNNLKGIRTDYFWYEKKLYERNQKYYYIDSFKDLHNYGI